jgi:hypothetical protein
MYLANYDTGGNILGFYIQGMHMNIPEPTLEITDEQHQEYFNKGQNHKVIDGKFVYVEPLVPTAEEVRQQKIKALDKEYNPKFDSLTLAWATAYMSGDTVTANARIADKTVLTNEYNTKKGVIENG